MSKTSQRLISAAVVLFLVVAIYLFLDRQPELFEALTQLTLAHAGLLLVARLGILAMNGLFLREFAHKFGVKLSFHEWFGLSVVTTMGNYLTPFSGGLVVRATYLKKRHQLPYTQFAILLASNYLIMFWLIGVVGLLTLWTLGEGWLTHWPIALLFGGVSGGISLVLLFPNWHFTGENRLSHSLNTVMQGWQMVKQDKGLLLRLVWLTFLTVAINGASFWLAYWALGVNISFSTALLLGLVAAFSIFINLTPGSIGVQEAMVALSSELLGAGSGLGLLAVLLIRAVTIVCVFSLGPLYSLFLTRAHPQS